jgi:hypothetical protein
MDEARVLKGYDGHAQGYDIGPGGGQQGLECDGGVLGLEVL